MIDFHSENVAYKLDKKRRVKSWLETVILEEGKSLAELTYVFCSDDYLNRINKQYLQHDTYTDIIAFDYGEGDDIGGDIFISIDRVKENAVSYQVSFEEEMHRVMVHGVLHLIGYKDKTSAEARLMRAKEDFYLSLFSE